MTAQTIDYDGQIVPPRYTTDERVGLTTETGSVIFNTTTSKMEYYNGCLLYTSPSPRDKRQSRMPSSA